jgi:hypothetical protein
MSPGCNGREQPGCVSTFRAWINEWDLLRLDPSFTPTTEAVELPTSWTELPELDEN